MIAAILAFFWITVAAFGALCAFLVFGQLPR
jgi:hypothetical protein